MKVNKLQDRHNAYTKYTWGWSLTMEYPGLMRGRAMAPGRHGMRMVHHEGRPGWRQLLMLMLMLPGAVGVSAAFCSCIGAHATGTAGCRLERSCSDCPWSLLSSCQTCRSGWGGASWQILG